ncbi:hypothetical protein [Dactylosporangium sp. NPDC000521]|uniref:hypothetical protein n=1 Tax=Dactylosporangium sp. NPDC000521 TaxID=3363975 RepID=UPI00367F4645
MFGNTFELCTVFDLADHMPYPHLLDALPPMEGLWTAWRAGFQPPPDDHEADFRHWRRAEPVPPAWLHAAGSDLAQRLEVVYQFGDTAESSRHWLAKWGMVCDTFNDRRRITAAEAATFRAFWQAHQAGPKDTLRQLGPVRAADVPLLGGHRMADLIAGTTMVEIKTGLMSDAVLADTVLQAAEYALAAPDAGYDIDNVVIYLARYRLIIRTPLQELANSLAGKPVDLASDRAALRQPEPLRSPNSRSRHHHGPLP